MIVGGLYLMVDRDRSAACGSSRRWAPRASPDARFANALSRRSAPTGRSASRTIWRLQRALLRDPRSARRGGRFHHRARNQPDVRRDRRRGAGRLLAARGSPADAVYVELGPGRGTLAADALRVLRRRGLRRRGAFRRDQPGAPRRAGRAGAAAPSGTSARRSARRRRCCWSPMNSSTRCRCGNGSAGSSAGRDRWRRLGVHRDGDDPREFAGPRCGGRRPLRASSRRHGGVALIIDYGHARSAAGDTLQAVRGHGFAPVLANPGEQDLTAHVDFEALAKAARATRRGGQPGSSARANGSSGSGSAPRAAALANANPERGDEIAAALERLTATRGNGRHCSRSWRIPAPTGRSRGVRA